MPDPSTKKLTSGAELTLNIASWDEADALQQAVIRELIAVQFDMDLKNLFGDDVSSKDINTIKNAVFQIAQSKAVRAALAPCLERCLYNGQKLTLKDTFNSPSARRDFYPVVWEVMKLNLAPFFADLNLLSLIGSLLPSGAPRSESAFESPDSFASSSPEPGMPAATRTP